MEIRAGPGPAPILFSYRGGFLLASYVRRVHWFCGLTGNLLCLAVVAILVPQLVSLRTQTRLEERMSYLRGTVSLFAFVSLVFLTYGAALAVETISFEVESAEYGISTGPLGGEVIRMDGFRTSGQPGAPLLPRKTFDVALPPSVNWDTVVVRAQDVAKSGLPGSYDIEPAGPSVAWPAEGEKIVDWGDAGKIVGGKDITVYGVNEYNPRHCAEMRGFSQMRKWKFVRVRFSPFAYNPATGRLTLVESARIVVQCETDGEPEPAVLFRDTVMDDLAKERFVNFDQAAEWYQSTGEKVARSGKDPTYDYVIITTNAIEAGSSKLDKFVGFKEWMGYSVLVITEDDWGTMTGQGPNGKAEKIRQWLISYYTTYGIEYVLLIGDPDPDDNEDGSDSVGDLPMKMCWPRKSADEHRQSPTDFFYADLTGNWDKDGDGYYGEYGDDTGSGGIDLTAEVWVGRIPVYGADYNQLDAIIQKTVDYQTASGNLSWREKILLPESFSDGDTDGADLAEHIMNDYLAGEGFSSYKMYQQGTCHSDDDSSFSSDEELLHDATVAHWAANPYGLVTWWAHGSAETAGIGYGTGVHDCGNLFNKWNCTNLDDSKPAIVFQNSCNNAFPEEVENLSYSLLKSGAVAAVGSTRVSWYLVGWDDPTGDLTNADLAYETDFQLSVMKRRAGRALAHPKSYLGLDGRAIFLMNAFDFNLYGDPQVHYEQHGTSGEYWVDGSSGSDSNDGSLHSPWKTITHALSYVPGTEWHPPSTINVRAGTYSPSTNGETFPLIMKDKTSLIGADESTTIIDAKGSAEHVIFAYYVDDFSIEDLTIQGGLANGTGIDAVGAGLYCRGSSLTVERCTLRQNIASSNGGGVYWYESGLSLDFCTMSGNEANTGSGVYAYGSELSIEDCAFEDNHANSSGGGIYANGCDGNVERCSFEGNTADGDGAGLYYYESSPYNKFLSVTGNTADADGGGVYCHNCSPLFVDFTQIRENKALADGGGVYCDTYASPTIRNALITDNTADDQGGGIYCRNYSEPNVVVCTLSGNAAGTTGGGIYATLNSTPHIINTILWGDTPHEIYESGTSNIDITYSCIEGGWTGTGNIDQDPLFVPLSDAPYYLSHASVQEEESPCIDAGNGTINAYAISSTTTCTDGHYDGDDDGDSNTGPIDMGYHHSDAYSGDGWQHYYVDGASGSDSNNGRYATPFKTITYALTQASGTAEYPVTIHIFEGTYGSSSNGETFPLQMKDYVSLVGEDVDRTVLHAGRSAFHVIYASGDDGVTIERLTIAGGYADGSGQDNRGGGIYCYNCSPTVSDCIIQYNYATYGAGFYGYGCSSEIRNCSFNGNDAGTYGGGLYLCVSSDPILTNCLIYSNSASSYGGAIYTNDSSPELRNCTLSRNEAGSTSAAVHCYNGSSPVIINSILWGDAPEEIYVAAAASIDVTYSDVEGGYTGTGNIDADPLFLRIANYHFYLSHAGVQAADSPSIDAGSGAVSDYGLDGTTTCTDGRADGDDDGNGATGPIDMGYHYAGAYTNTQYLDHYVDCTSGDDDNDGLSWATAFATIQKGIAICYSGTEEDRDIVHVAEGTYTEQAVLDSHTELLGGYPSGGGTRDPDAHTTIIRHPAKFVMNIRLREDVTVDGFTICDGRSANTGGIYCRESSAVTISNNTIRDNEATSSADGGGIRVIQSDVVIVDNVIADNISRHNGGGIWCQLEAYNEVVIVNNVIRGNRATSSGGGIGISGGGTTAPIIRNNLIIENTADLGGGLFLNASSPDVECCTLAGNRGASAGGGIQCHLDSHPSVINSILWSDTSEEIHLESGASIDITYSCIEGGFGGTGNIDEDPLFVEISDAYYLGHDGMQEADSPCIDAGCGAISDYGLDGLTTCTDGRVDGDDDSDGSTGPIDMGYHCDGPYFRHHYVDKTYGNDANNGYSWGLALQTIEMAVELCTTGNATDRDFIFVASETYYENVTLGSNVTLMGGYPAGGGARDPVEHETIVDGSSSGMVFRVLSQSNITIDGFTIQHGDTGDQGGGGFLCDKGEVIAVNDCIFTGNLAKYGGAIWLWDVVDGVISHCTMTGNHASERGGAIYLWDSPVDILNCIMADNIADGEGGGIYFAWLSSAHLASCTITGNEAGNKGGGLYCYKSSPTVINSILWGDTPQEISHFDSSSMVNITYSDIEGGHSGDGNIDQDPLFVPVPDVPYYIGHAGLQTEDSPCVDAGFGALSDYGLEGRTTCTDGHEDGDDDADGSTGPIDMGYHYTEGFPTTDYYVDKTNGSDTNNGLSWDYPFKTIQKGIDSCSKGYPGCPEKVHVAAETYYENLVLNSQVMLLGGFPAGGGERDYRANETIVNGGGTGPAAEIYLKDYVTIDGFTLTNGEYADGGGVYCEDSSTVNICNCLIVKNTAQYGGGIYCEDATGSIFNCAVRSNQADMSSYGRGGGAYLWNSTFTFTNCLVDRNFALEEGGGIYFAYLSHANLRSCTIGDNEATNGGGGIYCYKSSPTVINSILWGDTPNEISHYDGTSTVHITYSDVDGSGYGESGGCAPDSNGNMDCDPLFVNISGTPYFLSHTGAQTVDSPCLDAGSGSVSDYGLDDTTTCTDDRADGDDDGDGSTGPIDMGYHYPDGFSEHYYVTIYGDDSNDGQSWASAFMTIGKAVSECNTGIGDAPDIIHVGAGTYYDNVVMDRSIMMLGGYPAAGGTRDIYQYETIIDAHDHGRVITINDEKGVTIDGFTIQNGYDASGAGVYMYNYSPVIRNCTIQQNQATNYGAGVHCVQSTPEFTNCIFSDNLAAQLGGGMLSEDSSPVLTNCIFSENTSTSGGGAGACFYGSTADLRSCTFSKNQAGGKGGALHIDTSDVTVINSILWDDSPDEINLVSGTIDITYSDVEGGWKSTGVIDENPEFIWRPSGAYYLSHDGPQHSNSPCIDTGYGDVSDYGLEGKTTCTDGRADARPIDMGYHYPDGYFVGEYYVDKTGGDDDNDGLSWSTAFASIDKGVQSCVMGWSDEPDVIHVAAAIYYERVKPGSHILMLGGYPTGGGSRDPAANETVIDGNRWGSVVTIYGVVNVVMDGFTVRNGLDDDGGGFYVYNSSPVVSTCVIAHNEAAASGGGVACYSASPTFEDCVIEVNNADYGGGLYADGSSSPNLLGCTLMGNKAAYATLGSGAGAFFDSSPSATMFDCVLMYNVAEQVGGGVACRSCSPLLLNNIIACNEAAGGGGGGVCCYGGAPQIQSCTIADNEAADSGGGIRAEKSYPVVINTILWGNAPDQVCPDESDPIDITFSCIEGGYPGKSNIDSDPLFVPTSDPPDSYYLAHVGPQAGDSPCIDAGYGSVINYGLVGTTTSTDGSADGNDDGDSDTGPIDMGYHYRSGYEGQGNTYIELLSFEAKRLGNAILLTWETGAEIDNAGFVLFRNVAGARDYKQISGLISAKGTPISGALYSFFDRDVAFGAAYDYWLVDIETSGQWTAHGPASVQVRVVDVNAGGPGVPLR